MLFRGLTIWELRSIGDPAPKKFSTRIQAVDVVAILSVSTDEFSMQNDYDCWSWITSLQIA